MSRSNLCHLCQSSGTLQASNCNDVPLCHLCHSFYHLIYSVCVSSRFTVLKYTFTRARDSYVFSGTLAQNATSVYLQGLQRAKRVAQTGTTWHTLKFQQLGGF